MFTLNKNGHSETTVPTEIWIKFLVEFAGLFNRTLISSETPSMVKIPNNIIPKSVQAVMLNSLSSLLII